MGIVVAIQRMKIFSTLVGIIPMSNSTNHHMKLSESTLIICYLWKNRETLKLFHFSNFTVRVKTIFQLVLNLDGFFQCNNSYPYATDVWIFWCKYNIQRVERLYEFKLTEDIHNSFVQNEIRWVKIYSEM